jgi:regulator of sirC expression with transglutaminase-like and TPR domain
VLAFGDVVDPSCMRRFAEVIRPPEAELRLDVAALLLGEWEDGEVDVAQYLAELDRLADDAREARDELMDRTFASARAVTRVLFVERGFRGNADDYYDPRNSFLHQVLDRRVGIPISLSVLYMEVARRIGLQVNGVGFPGHFLIRAHDGDRAVVIDPFNGGAVLGKDDLQALLTRAAGPEAKLEPALLAPVTKPQILTRMLVNLAGVYGKRGDLFRSLEVLERLYLLDAGNSKIERELHQLRRRCDELN